MLSQRSPGDRRAALLEQCRSSIVVVRGTAPGGLNASFFYLTGIAEPRATLLLAAEGLRIRVGRKYPGPSYMSGEIVREVLFLPASDPEAARWGEDGRATFERFEGGSFEAVLPASELEPTLVRALEMRGRLDYVRGAAPSLAGPDDPDAEFVGRIQRRLFGVSIHDATSIVHEMRRLKDEGEVQAIERAVELTHSAIGSAVRLLRPGVHEYEIEAELTRHYRSARARHAFDPIVACGRNATVLHYQDNASPIEEGRLLLVDTGAALDGYHADVTRVFPTSGRFDARQRRVYEAVLQALRQATAMCRPGALLADVHAKAFDVIDRAGFADAFVHGTSHHLGLETHDAGDVHRPLDEGAVVTVEPGIYLADESIGVRLEDDVLVTSRGPRVLSEAIPTEIEDVERMMA